MILERNKWSIANPSSSINTQPQGTISGSDINSEYTDLFSYLSGNKKPYYDGNITGSYINVNAYFAENNIKKFLGSNV